MSVGSYLYTAVLNDAGDPEDEIFVAERYPKLTLIDKVLLSVESFVTEWEDQEAEDNSGEFESVTYDLYYGADLVPGLQRVIWLWNALSEHPDYRDVFSEKMIPEIREFAHCISKLPVLEPSPTDATEQQTPQFDAMVREMAINAREYMRLPPETQMSVLAKHTIPEPEKEILRQLQKADAQSGEQDFRKSSYPELREYLLSRVFVPQSVWLISAGDVLASDSEEAERELIVASEMGDVVEKYRDDPKKMLEELYLCGKDTSIMGYVWDIPEDQRKIDEYDLTEFIYEF